jgi:hypothetical protein
MADSSFDVALLAVVFSVGCISPQSLMHLKKKARGLEWLNELGGPRWPNELGSWIT